MNGFRKFTLIILLVTIIACSGPVKSPVVKEVATEDPVITCIFGSRSALFREVNLGMTVEAVKGSQKEISPEEEGADYLSYRFAFSDTLQGNYYFSFDNGLEEIGVDIFREKQKNCSWLFQRLKKYFTTKYGNMRQENELLIWHADKQGKEGAEITLADESADYGYGKLTITIFPFESSVDPKEKEAGTAPLSVILKESSNSAHN
jgi:hypothetical protein